MSDELTMAKLWEREESFVELIRRFLDGKADKEEEWFIVHIVDPQLILAIATWPRLTKGDV